AQVGPDPAEHAPEEAFVLALLVRVGRLPHAPDHPRDPGDHLDGVRDEVGHLADEAVPEALPAGLDRVLRLDARLLGLFTLLAEEPGDGIDFPYLVEDLLADAVAGDLVPLLELLLDPVDEPLEEPLFEIVALRLRVLERRARGLA